MCWCCAVDHTGQIFLSTERHRFTSRVENLWSNKSDLILSVYTNTVDYVSLASSFLKIPFSNASGTEPFSSVDLFQTRNYLENGKSRISKLRLFLPISQIYKLKCLPNRNARVVRTPTAQLNGVPRGARRVHAEGVHTNATRVRHLEHVARTRDDGIGDERPPVRHSVHCVAGEELAAMSDILSCKNGAGVQREV